MTNKTEVIALHKAWPHWPAKKLAAALNCTEGYVNACRVRYGLNIPYVRNGNADPLYKLAHAARRAGLTVAKINLLAAR